MYILCDKERFKLIKTTVYYNGKPNILTERKKN